MGGHRATAFCVPWGACAAGPGGHASAPCCKKVATTSRSRRGHVAVKLRPHGDPDAIPLHLNRSPDGRPLGDGIPRVMERLLGRPWGPRKRTAPHRNKVATTSRSRCGHVAARPPIPLRFGRSPDRRSRWAVTPCVKRGTGSTGPGRRASAPSRIRQESDGRQPQRRPYSRASTTPPKNRRRGAGPGVPSSKGTSVKAVGAPAAGRRRSTLPSMS